MITHLIPEMFTYGAVDEPKYDVALTVFQIIKRDPSIADSLNGLICHATIRTNTTSNVHKFVCLSLDYISLNSPGFSDLIPLPRNNKPRTSAIPGFDALFAVIPSTLSCSCTELATDSSSASRWWYRDCHTKLDGLFVVHHTHNIYRMQQTASKANEKSRNPKKILDFIVADDMPSVLANLRETGRVLVWQSEEGHYSHIGFPRRQQIASFRRFPDVVNVDVTHTTNRFGYKLCTFLITDGMGIGRPVRYAFVESEQLAPVGKLFGLFKEMMGEHHPVRIFGMDKLAAQMRAARVVFGCDVMPCCFHIRKAVRKHACIIYYSCIFGHRHTLQTADTYSTTWLARTTPYSNFLYTVLQTHRFRQDLQLLRRTDQRSVSYLTARWLYITRKWAVHA
ncbi:hypothetical protein CLF_100776 [Clonorchis sinensis]|uniref:ZSWIM1/3 RNaseH-like domain-containing protein n=1 Tax=Clonorchis sinensis TaxID=79923 RepID=G7Y479_CLOSI|nr:hypothetical protein CLF_100776 [Clonorchis sinensis]